MHLPRFLRWLVPRVTIRSSLGLEPRDLSELETLEAIEADEAEQARLEAEVRWDHDG